MSTTHLTFTKITYFYVQFLTKLWPYKNSLSNLRQMFILYTGSVMVMFLKRSIKYYREADGSLLCYVSFAL